MALYSAMTSRQICMCPKGGSTRAPRFRTGESFHDCIMSLVWGSRIGLATCSLTGEPEQSPARVPRSPLCLWKAIYGRVAVYKSKGSRVYPSRPKCFAGTLHAGRRSMDLATVGTPPLERRWRKRSFYLLSRVTFVPSISTYALLRAPTGRVTGP